MKRAAMLLVAVVVSSGWMSKQEAVQKVEAIQPHKLVLPKPTFVVKQTQPAEFKCRVRIGCSF